MLRRFLKALRLGVLALIDTLVEFWFQPVCPACESASFHKGLCVHCTPMVLMLGEICEKCGAETGIRVSECGECVQGMGEHLDQVRSLFRLTEDAKKLIHLVKFQNRFEWLSLFESGIRHFRFPFSEKGFTLIPVPIHTKRFLLRGFNQSEILMDHLREGRDLSVSLGLIKRRETSAQSSLKRMERQSNLKNAFVWSYPEPAPEQIVLVDDVYTTGATLRECAKVLKGAGAKKVVGWTLFRA